MEKLSTVELKNVFYSVDGKTILKNISLTIEGGSFLGIVGPNGGGKTTLLKIILGLIKPVSGTVMILGKKPEEVRGTGLIGYLPQNLMAGKNFPATAMDVVLMGTYKKGKIFYSDEDKENAIDILKTMSMFEKKDKLYGSLSGGEQQRVCVAQALVSRPSLLVLDEPSTGIDVVGQEDFYLLLKELKAKLQLTVIIVSHDIGVISSYVDNFACLNTTIHYHGKAKGVDLEELMHGLYEKKIDIIKHHNHCEECERKK